MKNILIITAILFTAISCKAQSTISLEQAYEYSKSDNGLPETITYVKDINNRLDQFVGTWKGSYGGKNYEFQFIKKLNFGDYSVKWDKIIGRFMVKDSSGNILDNTLNEVNDNNTRLRGSRLQIRAYEMNYVGNVEYCNDSGSVFIEISKTNLNQMTLYFSRDLTTYNPDKCPNFKSFVPLLPKEKMTLIKQ